jgi:hypothetical protein
MKKRQFEALCKKLLLPYLPGFACKGWLLYAEPIGHVLRGFCCDDSGFDPHRFRLWVFFLPLYVPTDYVHFNMGEIIYEGSRKHDQWWTINDPLLQSRLLAAIQENGLPFIQDIKAPLDVVRAISRLGNVSNPHRLEAIGYSLAMAGDVVRAWEALEHLKLLLDKASPWQAEMIQRAELLEEKLRLNPREAKHQLLEWERISLKNLDL